MEQWQEQHKEVIDDFLHFLNQETDEYVLKGGTALMECYALDRFSEDVDLDGVGDYLFTVVEEFCVKEGFTNRIAKNTDTVKRCMIHYGGEKPLKVELSSRNGKIPLEETTKIDGIRVYTIDRLAELKATAYSDRDKIRDVYDLSFICNNYLKELSPATKRRIKDTLIGKGFEQYDYIVSNQHDDLIDKDRLAFSYLQMWDNLGILTEPKERETILEPISSLVKEAVLEAMKETIADFAETEQYDERDFNPPEKTPPSHDDGFEL